jgi:hypothetical protein
MFIHLIFSNLLPHVSYVCACIYVYIHAYVCVYIYIYIYIHVIPTEGLQDMKMKKVFPSKNLHKTQILLFLLQLLQTWWQKPVTKLGEGCCVEISLARFSYKRYVKVRLNIGDIGIFSNCFTTCSPQTLHNIYVLQAAIC